jgi:hypothetical protein
MQLLSLFGFLLEVIGAYLLYRYGVPKHVLTDSPFGAVGAKEARPKKEAENLQYRKNSRLGFGLMCIGFIAQFAYSLYQYLR